MKKLILILLLISVKLHAKDVNILQYGAVADSTTLNSEAIQKAIDACHASGGGKVIVPAGKFLSGTLVLKSGVTLYLEKNAVILGSTDVNDYRNMDPFVDGLGIEVGWALIVAVDANDIGIMGEGAIDGQGSKLKEKHILTDTRPEGQRWGRRPFLVRIVRCNNVQVKGVTLLYAAAWTSHYFRCTNVQIEKIKILSKGVAHNDGIDIDGSQQVRIKDCDIESGDDALCFKTTWSKSACRDIVATGLRLKSNQGAIKMGTESMANFENIQISNCYIYNTNNGGIKLLTVDGAHLRNITISDITMDEVKTPILLRLGSRLSVFRKTADTQQTTGSFENVVIRNVKAKAAYNAQLTPASAVLITGVPGHYITNVTLENITVDLAGGGTAEHARQIVPEAIDKYPEVKTFGPTIPAYGIWVRHAKGLQLKNIQFTLAANDLRPAFVCEDGENIHLNNWTFPSVTGAQSIVRFENSKNVSVKSSSVNGSAEAFVRLEGTDDVQLSDNKISKDIKQSKENAGAANK